MKPATSQLAECHPTHRATPVRAPFLTLKTHMKLETEGNLLIPIKSTYETPVANIVLTGELFLRIRSKTGIPAITVSSQQCSGACRRWQEGSKKHPDLKGENKVAVFTDMIIYVKNAIESTKKAIKQNLVTQSCRIENKHTGLAGVAQWIEHRHSNQRVAGSIRSQGTCLGCGPGSYLGACERQPHIDVSLPLFSFPSPLSKNK